MNFNKKTIRPGLGILSGVSGLILIISIVTMLNLKEGKGDRNELKQAIKAQTTHLVGESHAQ